ncbi:hypothetical protein FoTM2_009567 [Fusarium oxysporum f. sp. vasinfectum]|nr:hypothetical protein FoTM2_009567 [Fusarium oxysporum f. sp. vasinfectum]
MSLSAKIKDILHSDESKDTTTETSHHPPGSFPTEEMEPSETYEGYSKGYEHNKLHKADDPRGHAHKDSGVGFTESNDPTSYQPSNEPISERRDDPLGRTTDTATTAGTTTAGTTTAGTTAAGGLGDTSKIPATEGATDAAAPSTQDHPYWGDLPSGGVHNTVIGHGSPEDENARHRTVHSGATEPTRTAGTLESGTFLHRNDRDTTSSTTNPHDAQRSTQENPSQTSGSHFNEGVAGVGAAGAGALGAHELNKRRHADDTQTPSKVDQTTDKTHDEHKGRSFPLLGKDHKDKETHHKEDKHAKEPKESKLGALTSTRDPTSQTYQQQSSHGDHSLAKGTAAGLGAGTLASYSGQHSSSNQPSALGSSSAYGAQPDQPANFSHKDPHTGLDSSRGLESQGNQSAYSSTNPTSQHQQHDSHRGAGLAAGTAAGLGAGALASRSGRDHETTGQLGLDSSRDLESQTTQPGYSSTNPTSQHQQGNSHHSTGLATGAAAGLGAGALASRSGRDHHSDQPTGLDSNRGFESQTTQPTSTSTRDPTSQSYQQEGSHRGAGLATGAAAGLGAGALASHDSRHEPSRKSEHSQRSTGSHHSTLTENANAGKYNTLASGTPSGVAYDDDLSTNRSSQQPASQKKDDHFGAKAAGLGAAAAGAGSAAALSRNKDEKPITGAVAPQMGTNKPVIHKCQKCGEDNDISKYFTSDSRKI